MNGFKLRKNHRFLTTTYEIKQICKPLDLLKIHLFTYFKKFENGSEIYLSNNAQWIDNYYSLGLYNSSVFANNALKIQKGFMTWSADSNLPVLEHGRLYFKSDNGITYCNTNKEDTEFFFFSSSNEYSKCISNYLSNADLLLKFIFHFKEKANKLIQMCHKNRIVLPASKSPDSFLNLEAAREAFCKALGSEKSPSFIQLSNFDTLTRSEKICLNLLPIEHTATNIAARLGLSRRTIETHLEHAREKLHCSNKIELLLKLISCNG